VLLYVAGYPGARVRDIAAAVGITERRAYAVLRELEDAGYVVRRRVGRGVEFAIREEAPMRASLVRHLPVRQLLRLLDVTEPPSD
jgi:DNA-binding transcriptional ArsR family regulator